MNSLVNQQSQHQQDGLKETLRLTSLLYLKEALRKEAYEQCAQILGEAKEIGVDPEEVRKLVQEHLAFLKERERKIVPFRVRKP